MMNWNGMLTVTPDDEGQERLVSVPIDEFCFFELVGKKMLGQTADATFLVPWNSIKVLQALLSASCDHFERVDKASIVNVHRIAEIDWEWGILYFGDATDKDRKRCLVAGAHASTLKQRLERAQAGFKPI